MRNRYKGPEPSQGNSATVSALALMDAINQIRDRVEELQTARQLHLAQLAQLDRAIWSGNDLETVRSLLQDLMGQAGIRRLDAVGDVNDHSDAFTPRREPGNHYAVQLPAYLDQVGRRVVERGRLEVRAAVTPNEGA